MGQLPSSYARHPAAAAGQLEVADVEATTHLLAGALVDAALRLGQAPDDASLHRRMKGALLRLVRGLGPRVPGGTARSGPPP